ncbi:PapB/FocB family fimbrial expression transcriptional regulator [Edwardsiella piscicida]
MNKGTPLRSEIRCFATATRKQNRLCSGELSENQFWLLVEISLISSEKIIDAMWEYLILGRTRKEICERIGVSNGYLSTSLRRLSHIHHIVSCLACYYKT